MSLPREAFEVVILGGGIAGNAVPASAFDERVYERLFARIG
jgi:hypothetical protein